MHIPLDREGETPLYWQIRDYLADRIRSGALPAGARLPPARSLAASLRVSRITVIGAYADLQAEGLVNARVGKGTFVAPADPSSSPAGEVPAVPQRWQPALAYGLEAAQGLPVREMLRLAQQPGVISFAGGMPPRDFFPVAEFQRAIDQVLREDGAAALEYEPSEGHPPLRRSIARHLAGQGVAVHPEDILITSGSQQGLHLAAGALLRRGDFVVTESPTYRGAIEIFEFQGARLLGAPMDEGGVRVDVVEGLVQQYRPKLIYTLPTFHNPAGICLEEDRRRQLLALAQHHGIPILEHDTCSDLRYEGPSLVPLKARDAHGHVIYAGTFSKTLLPGIRLGYVVASGALYEKLREAKQITDLHTSSLSQRAMHRYLEAGYLERHLRRVRQVYRERRDAMVVSLRRHLPAEVVWSVPAGGLYLWLTLPPEVSLTDLYLEAIARGVAFALGSVFFPDKVHQNAFRLNFVLHPPAEIEEGMRRLGAAVGHQLRRTQGPSTTETAATIVPLV